MSKKPSTRTIKVVEPDGPEVQEAQRVVCMRKADDPKTFSDNQEGICVECGETVVFRPHAPKVDKVCVQCAMPYILGLRGDEALEILATRKTVEEVAAVLLPTDGKVH